jgi:hypothetical protein
LLKSIGADITSSMSGVKSFIRCGSVVYSFYYDGLPRTHPSWGKTDTFTGHPGFDIIQQTASTVVDPSADQAARGKLLEKMISARKSWRGGNFLAEVAETIHMLKAPVKSLLSSTEGFAKSVGKLNISRIHPLDYGKRLGDLWLGWAFGWKPLFDDVRDANAAMQHLINRRGFDSVRVQGTGVSRSSSFQPRLSTTVGSYCLMDRTRKSYNSVKYYGVLQARPSALGQILDNFGVDPGDILPAVWEAIPWSFFVDYFVNVQEMIDSMQWATAGDGWYVRAVRNVSSIQIQYYPQTQGLPANAVVQASGKLIAGQQYIARSPLGSIPPRPSWHFKIPGVGSQKWLNIGALISAIRASRPGNLGWEYP